MFYQLENLDAENVSPSWWNTNFNYYKILSISLTSTQETQYYDEKLKTTLTKKYSSIKQYKVKRFVSYK